MRKPLAAIAVVALAIFFEVITAFAQGTPSDFPNYGEGSPALTATPGTQGGAAAAFWNPAAWAAMREFEMSFLWNDRNVTPKRMDNWGLFLGGHGVGFAMRRNNYLSYGSGATDPLARHLDGEPSALDDRPALRARRVDDYQLAIGGGTRDDYWGLSYNWSKGDTRGLNRDHHLTLGNIARPLRWLSIGNSASLGLDGGDYRGISDLGVRPFSNHRLTLFADAAYGRLDNFETMQWGTGLEIQPLDGVRLAAKLAKPYGHAQDKVFSISLGLALDGTGFQIVPHYDKDSERLSTSYLIRVGEQFPSFNAERYVKDKPQVVAVPMKGRLSYRKARWFDRDRIALLDMIELIENAKHDPEIDGIALNLSGLESSRELLWEVREKLTEFKASGKQVYVYVDRAGMFTYYFATVADKVWMDPAGNLIMPGMVAGRTFWKGFLEKIGLSAEEFRYFTYKSAFEMLSRRDMSEPDREQRLAMIADLYDEWRGGITEERGISMDALDAIVDSVVMLNASDALDAGLVDTVASWSDVRDLIEEWSGKKPELGSRHDVQAYSFADPNWGEPPKVAVVYAIGDCDMDTGIRARYTSRTLNKLAKRKDVKAVVLRADSPGGDALPSDLVSREMKALAKKKPMIVSQGNVAASGGYWISMYGTRIFASPLTLTGSIGVIGGFVWNDGFSEKTGFSYDHVQIGRHADLGHGVTLPLLGVAIPDRPVTDEERSGAERLIRRWYDDFTAKVAEGRLLTQSYVDSVGQGRIWSGTRALELGLVDEIGGLDHAIVHARIAAGLPARGRWVEVIEFPPRSWVNPEDFGPSTGALGLAAAWLGLGSNSHEKLADDYELRFYRRISLNPGQPLFMVHPADLPAEE